MAEGGLARDSSQEEDSAYAEEIPLPPGGIVNEIIVLFNGHSYRNKIEGHTVANCTSTLIRGRNSVIVVDTRTAWDGEALLKALAQYGTAADEVTHVVCTHSHSDHIGCNYLFTNAKMHIVGTEISHHEKYEYFRWHQSYVIDDGIGVRKTPGHTLDSVSVIVFNTNMGKRVAIVGDLFEKVEDIDDPEIWRSAGTDSEAEQEASRLSMIKAMNVIIPGHGPPFEVTERMRTVLAEQSKEFFV